MVPHHEVWSEHCVSWANALRRMTLTRSTPYTCSLRPSLAYRQNLFLSLKKTECHSTLQSNISRHQSNHVWRCRGVSGSLARGPRDLSPAASRWFPMVLGDTAGVTCAQTSSLDSVRAATAARIMRRSWRASVLSGRPEPGIQVWECSTGNCWKQRNTTDALSPAD